MTWTLLLILLPYGEHNFSPVVTTITGLASEKDCRKAGLKFIGTEPQSGLLTADRQYVCLPIRTAEQAFTCESDRITGLERDK
jgi:hypothetical protein